MGTDCVKYWQFVTGGHMVLIDLFGGLCLVWLALFPGLPPTVFCSSVFCALPLPRIILNETEEQKKKRGRPGNEASVVLGSLVAFAVLLSVAWQIIMYDKAPIQFAYSAGCTSTYIIDAYLAEQLGNNHLTALLLSLLWMGTKLQRAWLHQHQSWSWSSGLLAKGK